MKSGIFIFGFLGLLALNGHSQFIQTITSADGRFLLNKIEAPLLGSEQNIKTTFKESASYSWMIFSPLGQRPMSALRCCYIMAHRV